LKQHTVIFVPSARAKFRKWRFTTLQAVLLCGTLTVLTVGGLAATFLYFDTAFDRDALDEMEHENADLRRVNQGFETSIRDLEGQLADYQERIHKLAIVAGVSELSPTADAGIGGPVLIDGDLGPEELQAAPMDRNLSAIGTQMADLGRSMDLLQERFDQQRLQISSTPAITPVKGLLTSRFGYRKDPFTQRRAFHNGIDIVAPRGKGVVATGDGIVTKVGRDQGLGNAVFISHGFGLTTRYGHLSRAGVKPGQKVRRGEVVGYVGNTGRATGYHLHYEVRENGHPTDPLGYILNSTHP